MSAGRTIPLFVLLFSLSVSCGFAELYEYTDENGVTALASNYAAVPEKYRGSVRTIQSRGRSNASSAGTEKAKPRPAPAKAAAQSPPVVTTPPGAVVVGERKISAERLAELTTMPAPRATGRLEVYISKKCEVCEEAIRHLDRNAVSYDAYYVDQDERAYARFQQLGTGYVPTFVYNGQVHRGPGVLNTLVEEIRGSR